MTSQLRPLRRAGLKWTAALCVFVTLGLLGPTGDAGSPPPGEPLSVVVSLLPWADLLSQVGGDEVEVQTLLPAGASPHAFEPLPSQALLLADADLVVLNGGIDGWLTRLLDAAAPDARRLVVMERAAFEPIQGHEHEEGSEREDDHDHAAERGHDDHGSEAANPHIWLDPVIAGSAVAVFAEELSSLLPDRAELFRSNAEALQSELAALDDELAAALESVRGEPFVPFHDAWTYFIRRYGLDVVATLEPFPGREPSARYVAETVAEVRRAGARVLFDERQLSGRTAVVVAEAAGLRVVMLDPIGGEPGPATYQALLRHNAILIAEALSGD